MFAPDCEFNSFYEGQNGSVKKTDDTGVGSVVRQVGEHHNPGGGVRLARFDGCRHAHSGQPANDPHDRRWHGEERIDANVAEEIVDSTNTVIKGL